MKRQLTQTLPLERFSYADGHLTAFESDLRDRPFDGRYAWLQSLYFDAIDEGMAIRRAADGKVIRFVLVEVERNEGDVLAFHFIPEEGQNTGIKRVTIFND